MLVGPIQIMTANVAEFSWQRTRSYFAYLQTNMPLVENTASMSILCIYFIHNSLQIFPVFYLSINISFAGKSIELSMEFTCFWRAIGYNLTAEMMCIHRKTHWHCSKNTIFQHRWSLVCILHAYCFSLTWAFWRAILRAKSEQNNQQMLTLYFCAGAIHHIPIDEQSIFRHSKLSGFQSGKICKKYLRTWNNSLLLLQIY